MSDQQTTSTIGTSFQLAKVSWRALRLNKQLVWLSAARLIPLMVVAIAAVVAFYNGYAHLLTPSGTETHTQHKSLLDSLVGGSGVVKIALLLLISFVYLTVSNFLAVAISWSALRSFDGQRTTVRESLAEASKKKGAILLYSLIEAVFGRVVNVILERIPFGIGRIILGFVLNVSWAIATFFAIPVMATSDIQNPFTVVKKSSSTLKSVWKESVTTGVTVATLAFVFFFSIALAAAVVGLVVGGALGSVAVIGGSLIITAVVGVIVGVISSALQGVLDSALFYYATTNTVPAGFDEELLRKMIKPRKAWLV